MSRGCFQEEHGIFRRNFRQFIEKEVAPYTLDWEEKGEWPKSVLRRMGELGFLGLRHKEEHGGAGADYLYTVVMAEELPRCGVSGFPMGIMVHTDMATPIIGKLGSPEQVERFLKPAIRGEKLAALAITEPQAGSDVGAIKTSAKKDGGEYVINGSKLFITNGANADFLTLAVKTAPEQGLHGISFFLFPTDTPGFQVTKKLKKMGNHSSDTAELVFEDARVPKEYLLGEENMGFYYIMQNFQGERLIAAVAAVAGSQLLLDLTIQYAKDRQAFGRPIIKFQVNRHKIVDMATRIAVARSFVYDVCGAFNEFDSAQSADPAHAVPFELVKEISMAKLFATEAAKLVADECVQLHGGYGYIEEFPVARAYRDTRLLSIGGGTSEIMKEIIGKIMDL